MASFTIAGKFNTIQKAEENFNYLKSLLTNIRETRPLNGNLPSYFENEVSEKFGIEWDEGIDWISENIDEHIFHYEHYVFVTTGSLSKTRQYPHALKQLMSKLSDEIALKWSNGWESIILTEMQCVAPDEQTASDLVKEIGRFIEHPRREFMIAPWEHYTPARNSSGRVFLSDFLKSSYFYAEDQAPLQEIIKSLYQYQVARLQNEDLKQVEKNAIDVLFKLQSHGFKRLPSGENLMDFVKDVGMYNDGGVLGGEIIQKQTQIVIPEIAFYHVEHGLGAIIDYLKDKGCANFTYRLYDVLYSSRPQYI